MDDEDFDASEVGVAFGRYQKSTGTYNFIAMSENTPWLPNAYPKVGPIVINEIMYHPNDNPDAEYVELLNISDSTVTLYDFDANESWKFVDDAGDDTPKLEFYFWHDSQDITIEPNEYILLVRDISAFAVEFGGVPSVQIFQWEDGGLNNGGEKPQLSLPGDEVGDTHYYIRVDRVTYDDEHPWPTEPDGSGASLSRVFPYYYGNDPNNWQAASPTPGSSP
jgi:hypothetical protein